MVPWYSWTAGTMVLRHTRNHLPTDMTSHPRRLKSYAVWMWEPQILQLCFIYCNERRPVWSYEGPWIPNFIIVQPVLCVFVKWIQTKLHRTVWAMCDCISFCFVLGTVCAVCYDLCWVWLHCVVFCAACASHSVLCCCGSCERSKEEYQWYSSGLFVRLGCYTGDI